MRSLFRGFLICSMYVAGVVVSIFGLLPKLGWFFKGLLVQRERNNLFFLSLLVNY